MGRVTAPYAVQGWIRIQPYTSTPGSLLDYGFWWLGPADTGCGWRRYQVLAGRVHRHGLLAQLADVRDRTAAQALQGMDVAVDRAEFPGTDADEYYWDDLIGLEVVNVQGMVLGEVAGLLETGAHDVLRVGHARGERLIPFVHAYVREVDRPGRRILVEWDANWDQD
ncbi:MAG TPA: ribosome maturation factor RimM [Thiobacillaceae bacterium]|nr:ribosome maturation factor RimM [Thiobacillaceae bacterium]